MTDFQALHANRRTPRPLFAIGDMHGHADALATMLAHLRLVIDAEYGAAPVDLVHLGDYVDRGPDPLGVMALVRDGLERDTVAEVALLGNHDWFLAAAAQLRGETLSLRQWNVWLSNGGRETLDALGELSYTTARPERILTALGPENATFLSNLSLSARFGDVLCVHAGIDPGIALDDQRQEDLIWIREPFLEPAEREQGWPPDVLVVHGHTPSAHGVFPHRIGVDTGGFHTGVFTALEIRDGRARFHHVVRDGVDLG
ncbi:MAG: metallophosphoesterase [Pseudomonadota bacterium]